MTKAQEVLDALWEPVIDDIVTWRNQRNTRDIRGFVSSIEGNGHIYVRPISDAIVTYSFRTCYGPWEPSRVTLVTYDEG